MAQQTEHFDSSSLPPCGRAEDDGHPDAYPAASFIDYDDEPNIMTDPAWALLDGHRDHESRRFRAEDASKRFLSLLQPMGNIISMELEPELNLDTPSSQSLTVSASYQELYDRLDDCDPIEFPLAPSSVTLPTSPRADVTVFDRNIDSESPPGFFRWDSTYMMAPVGIYDTIGSHTNPPYRASSLLVPRTKQAPIEKCIDPSKLSIVPIPTVQSISDSEDEEEQQWDTFDTSGSEDEVDKNGDCSSSEVESDNASVENREPTPGLSLTASTSPSPSPSSAYPSTPTADWAEGDSSLKASGPHIELKGKRLASPPKQESADANDLSSEFQKKRKRGTGGCEDAISSVSTQDCKPDSKSETGGNDVIPAGTSGDLLSREFLFKKFDIHFVCDTDRRWGCPFLPEDSLGRVCQALLTADCIMSHVRLHRKRWEETHPGEALQCPKHNYDKCRWRKQEGKPLKVSDPNEGLPRHVLDQHLKARVLQCACGAKLGRPTKDQIPRHLRTPQHGKNLKERRKKDPNIPIYPDVDDPRLVDEQDEESGKTGNIGASDDKGEGSSKRTKRRRF